MRTGAHAPDPDCVNWACDGPIPPFLTSYSLLSPLALLVSLFLRARSNSKRLNLLNNVKIVATHLKWKIPRPLPSPNPGPWPSPKSTWPTSGLM